MSLAVLAARQWATIARASIIPYSPSVGGTLPRFTKAGSGPYRGKLDYEHNSEIYSIFSAVDASGVRRNGEPCMATKTSEERDNNEHRDTISNEQL